MTIKPQVVHEGKIYYSVPLTAKLLGTTTTKVRQLIEPEKLDWQNFRVNGGIYISAESIVAYMRRREKR